MAAPTVLAHRTRPVRRTAAALAAGLALGLAGATITACGTGAGAIGSGTRPTPVGPRPTTTAGGPATTWAPATELDPGLVAALDAATTAAARADIHITVNSGYRTPERQQQLLDEEIEKRGSRDAALRWVFTPERSMHVQGLAVDIGNGPAADWLDDNGHRYGLCRTLDWEWWHFEWRSTWQQHDRCPQPAQDPTQAPTRAG